MSALKCNFLISELFTNALKWSDVVASSKSNTGRPYLQKKTFINGGIFYLLTRKCLKAATFLQKFCGSVKQSLKNGPNILESSRLKLSSKEIERSNENMTLKFELLQLWFGFHLIKMSLVWINCFRRLKEEAQNAEREEQEKIAKQQKLRKINKAARREEKVLKAKSATPRKVSFNSIVHVICGQFRGSLIHFIPR